MEDEAIIQTPVKIKLVDFLKLARGVEKRSSENFLSDSRRNNFIIIIIQYCNNNNNNNNNNSILN